MSKRVLVIGGVAGGASTAARVRRLDEQAEIIMFEKGPRIFLQLFVAISFKWNR